MSAPRTRTKSICIAIADQSAIMRGMMMRVLQAEGMQIVVTAGSTEELITKLDKPAPNSPPPNVLIVDIRFGTEHIAKIHEVHPALRIIVSSTMNENNVMRGIDALDCGAKELLTKPASRKTPEDTKNFIQELLHKVKKIGEESAVLSPQASPIALAKMMAPKPPTAAPPPATDEPIQLRPIPANFQPRALAIASSTGGPKALHVLLELIAPHIQNMPTFITQHMPKGFTTSLASQIANRAKMPCIEGEEGKVALPGTAYVAPGGYHMLVRKAAHEVKIIIDSGPQENFCRPAADPMLRSLHKTYGKDLLVIVLTGMGHDGREGAKVIVEDGGVVLAQDAASSVVWGMPGAVAKAGLCAHVLSLPQMADVVVKICNGTMK